ncbi:FG-GAP-like repeat-containing protein [Actinomadura sp. DC4]|uniref:FG-GAP-like repeat-containing protein n=1 Tax=Actinomadura sp. DC4 TaxID=3055069 RepID=UPI0025B026E0|nr:FG-GAP-like repeat-containing protein [Actinomadura sp. DC4]MDN3352976.1 FG-GAP-like repeat-containing protein [Actinomadura sp. DC4]
MKVRVFSRVLAVTAVTTLGAAGMAAAIHAAAAPAKATAAAAVKAAATGAKPYDFNGDGYADVALGDPYGKVGSLSSAGFVSIAYGAKTGATGSKKQVISQNTAGVPGSAEATDHFGYSVASLDYDHDGYADLLVGAPDEDTTSGSNAGSETILWGSKSGLTGTGSQTLAEPSNAGAGHRFGFALATGDIDGDGVTDWVDTSPGDAYFWTFASGGQALRATSARTFHPATKFRAVRGAKSGLKADAVTTLDALIPATGDVDGDGRTDLVVAWRNSKAEPKSQYGFDVWTSVEATSPANEVLTKTDALAVGDFDGDGYADVAAGASDDSGREHSHLVVFKGDASVGMSDSTMINEDTAGVPGATALGDKFGASLSAGDVNKDGKADLAVGLPGRTVSSKARAGEAIVLYGSASGLTGTGSQAVSQSTANVAGAAEVDDAFGTGVSLLDVTGDGRADLIAGASGENSLDGAVSVLLGGAGGVTGTGSTGFGAGTIGVTGKSAQIGRIVGRLG